MLVETDGGVFFDLPDSKVSDRLPGPPADCPTILRFKVELLRRLLIRDRALALGELSCDRSRRLAGELFDCATWSRLREECQEVVASDRPSRRRYLAVCDQEISAAGGLMCELLGSGLAEARTPLDSELELLAESPRDRGPVERLDRLGESLSRVEVEVA